MSLGVAIKGAAGVVLAADSRVTLWVRQGDGQQFLVNFDNASKLLSFGEPHGYVGAVTYGIAVIGQRTAQSYIPELEASLGEARLTVQDYASKLGEFYMERWEGPEGPPGMTFLVGGYDEGNPYGSLFELNVPNSTEPLQRNPTDFGMAWGGQLEVASRIIHGLDPMALPVIRQTLNLDDEQVSALSNALGPALEFKVPYDLLPLQDCVDLATFLVRTTITAQTLSIGPRGVGGVIEVATITKTDGLEFVQKKKIRGEA